MVNTAAPLSTNQPIATLPPIVASAAACIHVVCGQSVILHVDLDLIKEFQTNKGTRDHQQQLYCNSCSDHSSFSGREPRMLFLHEDSFVIYFSESVRRRSPQTTEL